MSMRYNSASRIWGGPVKSLEVSIVHNTPILRFGASTWPKDHKGSAHVRSLIYPIYILHANIHCFVLHPKEGHHAYEITRNPSEPFCQRTIKSKNTKL